jgi:hypothetical protein
MHRRVAPKKEASDGNGKKKNSLGSQVKIRQLVDRPRKPDEVFTRAYAIYNQCRHCRGWEGDGRSLPAEVYACPNTDCPFHPVRCRRAVLEAQKCAQRGSDDLDPSGISEALPVHKNGGKPGLRQAIQKYCSEWCQCLKPGESRGPVRSCTTLGCHVHPWRNGALTLDTGQGDLVGNP